MFDLVVMETPLNIVAEAHRQIAAVLREGDEVLDATCGNGHDTAFLARTVGPSGKVYAVDIQEQALTSTRALLDRERLLRRVTLIHGNHSSLNDILPQGSGPFRAIMYNLGFLPLSDKAVVTRADTTIRSLRQALGLLAPGGMISIAAYRGHDEGAEEAQAIVGWAEELPEDITARTIEPESALLPPVLWLITKSPACDPGA